MLFRSAALLEWSLRLDIALHALMFTLSGVPVLYSGDEIARRNDDAYHDDPLKAGDSRYLHRGAMDWEAAEKRDDPAAPEGRVFQAIRKLEALRAEHAAFDTSAQVSLLPCPDDSLLGIERCGGGERLLALFNFSDVSKNPMPGDSGRYLDLWTGKAVRGGALTLPAGGFAWVIEQ